MKAESAAFQPQNIREVPKRIVFQLDVSLDTLNYCAWTDAINENRNYGTINEFQNALHQCKLIHPDDVHTVEQIIQTEANPSMAQKVDIRLFTNTVNYTWYRLYVVVPENQQAHTHSISGVLESLQSMWGSTHHKHERLNPDTLFHHAVNSSAILSVGFHGSTGERLVSNYDVLPPWIPEDIRLKDIIRFLREHVSSPENPCQFEDLLIAPNIVTDKYNGKPFYRDCRLPDLTKKTEELRWYRVYHSLTKETRSSPACFFLTVMDIQEDRIREQLLNENNTYDYTTGMLKRCAFEHQVTVWLENVRSEASYSYVCSMVIVIDHAVDMIALKGRDYVVKKVCTLGKTIKAFIHEHEMCGRYGLAQFAMALSGTSAEILQERMKMLLMICRSFNSEWPDMQLRFGSNLELASHTEQGDVLLEKAYQALHEVENNIHPMKTPLNGNSHGKTAPHSCGTGAVCVPHDAAATNNKQHIFIRTFGHFDVFVDGEAVLFNHTKAKELLALLVDRRGGFVGASEAISCLWEDEPANNTTLSRCRKAALHLREILMKYDIEYLIETVNGKRRILTGFCDCDYYQYLQHGADSSQKMLGYYMSEYSWAESSVVQEQRLLS